MEAEELIRVARERSVQLEVAAASVEEALDRLRAECVAFWGEIPEPPLYRRAEDPARKVAEALVPRAQELLARCLAVVRAGGTQGELLAEAMELHLAALCHTAGGRHAAAESSWLQACELERRAASVRRQWARSDEGAPPVFDRKSGESRYDPRPEPLVKAKLSCIAPSCRKMEDYSFSPRYPSHRFVCPSCQEAFIGYFAEVEAAAVERRAGSRVYRFRLQEVGGGRSRLEFEEGSENELKAARGDLMAFLYSESRELKVVLDLSTSRVLWLARRGCFLATAAFGPGAPELIAFRAYRDQVMMGSWLGRRLVRGYYRVGPCLARHLVDRPRARRVVRAILGRVHRELVRSGYR